MNGKITAFAIGNGDGSYGVVGDAEAVTVTGGVAAITLAGGVVETFAVSISNGSSLNNPSDDSITVSIASAAQIAITAAASDFSTNGNSSLTVAVQDASGNTITTDSSTVITFTPTLGGKITAVGTGTGDGSDNVAAGHAQRAIIESTIRS